MTGEAGKRQGQRRVTVDANMGARRSKNNTRRVGVYKNVPYKYLRQLRARPMELLTLNFGSCSVINTVAATCAP